MNWRNVLYLLRIERKSGRLLRGIKTTRYRENKFIAYWPYWVAAILGVVGGLGASVIAQAYYSSVTGSGIPPLSVEAVSFYSVLPTLVLAISVVFTLFQQIQLAGKASSQVMYWLPVTWEEHTLASVLASLFGWPAALVTGLSVGLIFFSALNGLILQGVLTMLVLFAAAFLASSLTEIVRVLQVRFTGAVYKSSGRAAIWVRFISILLFIAIFYAVYFYAVYGTGSFISTLTAVQSMAWYVPLIWPALVITYVAKNVLWLSSLFAAVSAVFIIGLYYLAVELNKRLGLYEPPAITIQKSGMYAPKIGFLGKLGFSSIEAALIRKDMRAFTRRRELLSLYIFPIIIFIIGIFNSLGINGGSGSAAATGPFGLFWAVWIFLIPASSMAMWLGESMIGEEGQVMWRIYASPISAKNLVRSKFFFVVLLSIIILFVSAGVAVVFYHPSLRFAIVSTVEAFLMIFPVGAVSLLIGIKGADFTQTRRARMVRQEWSLLGFVASAAVGAAMLAPVFVVYFMSQFITHASASTLSYAIAVAISAAIALVIYAVFNRINIGSTEELLKKAEM
jgi:hypothetical protein